MDIRMPAMDGLAATKELTALPDPPRIIMLTTFELDEYVHTALENGAVGFLLKDTPPQRPHPGRPHSGRGQRRDRQAPVREATVKAHVSHVLAKLNLTNRVQAAMLVHDAGLTGT